MTGPTTTDRSRTPRTRLLGLIAVGLGGAGLAVGTVLHTRGHDGAGPALLISLLAVTAGMGCLAAIVTPVRNRGREGVR